MAGGGNRFVLPYQTIVDAAGVPIDGAKVYFYETGTTTPQATYSNSAMTVANANPVVADSAGRLPNIFLLLSPAYRVVVTDADDVAIGTYDPVGPVVGVTDGVPVGCMMDFGGIEDLVPAGWLLCYGQEVSRSTYSALWNIIGTNYGPGDGSTTFNLPDRRGRVSIGKDDMGGVAANRVTKAVSGIDAVVLGAGGGDQLAMKHTHALTDPGHTHTVTDPGHTHVQRLPNAFVAGDSQMLQQFNGLRGGDAWGSIVTGSRTTGVSINSATTGITISDALTGGAQNMPPGQVNNVIIFAGA